MMTTPRRSRSDLTRRELIRRAGMLGAAAGLAGALGPAALGRAASGSSPRPAPARRLRSGEGGALYFDNWTDYVDPTEDGHVGTVDRFIEATGIDMRYEEGYNDNNEYFALIQPLLGRGEAIEPDVIAPTSWLAGRLIGLGWVDEIPVDDIPNLANLRADLVKPSWDPDGKFSVPWQTGLTGIAYNLAETGRELNSVEDLFDPEFAGKIGMLTEMRDTIGLLLLAEGVDITSLTSFDQAAAAFERLEAAKNDGQIRSFTGNDYINDLSSGNLAACFGWSGDIIQLNLENPDIRFVIPEEGGISWADTMVIPKGSPNADSVAKWIDFVYDPANAAEITAWVQYVSPVTGVQELVAEIDPDLAESTLLFPDDETLARLQTFANLDEPTEAEFDAAFSEIVGA